MTKQQASGPRHSLVNKWGSVDDTTENLIGSTIHGALDTGF